MKKFLAVAGLPVALLLMFSCKKDKNNTPSKPAGLYADTVSGQYFRMTQKDSTVILRVPADTLMLGMYGSTYELWAETRNDDNFGGHFEFGKTLPSTPGTYKAYYEFAGDVLYADSIEYTITKAATKNGDTMEASYKALMHGEYSKDTTTVKGDFRLVVDNKDADSNL